MVSFLLFVDWLIAATCCGTLTLGFLGSEPQVKRSMADFFTFFKGLAGVIRKEGRACSFQRQSPAKYAGEISGGARFSRRVGSGGAFRYRIGCWPFFSNLPAIFEFRRVVVSGYHPLVIEKLISGGQTGADIAALDVALRFGFPHGGWCPKGRRSLEGPIPTRYNLFETPSASYLQRTEWNVRDSDGTVVFTMAAVVTGGSLRTIEFARKHGKPCLHLSREVGLFGYRDRSELLQAFVREHSVRRLNVAGSRESKEPGIHSWVMEVLEQAFFWDRSNPGRLGGPGEG